MVIKGGEIYENKFGVFILVSVLLLSMGITRTNASAALADPSEVSPNATLTKYWTECSFQINLAYYPYGVPHTHYCMKVVHGQGMGGYLSLDTSVNVSGNMYKYVGYLYPLNSGGVLAPAKVEDEEEE